METQPAESVPAVPFPDRCSFPPRPGNAVRPLVDGDETYAAIRAAAERPETRSLWVVVSFIHLDFRIDGDYSFFDYLQVLCSRGVDVRVLFWRRVGDNKLFVNSFPASAQTHSWLTSSGITSVKMRWDASPDPRHCHHEKTWIVDGSDASSAIVFTGGIIPGNGWMGGRDHSDPSRKHDIFAELRGPAAADVSFSFVQRWNNAKGAKQDQFASFPDIVTADDIPWPVGDSAAVANGAAAPVGQATVQVLRDLSPGHYPDQGVAPVGCTVFKSLVSGEDSILAAYHNAISAARETIYIENQHIAHEGVLRMLDEALVRGVTVIYIVPSVVFSYQAGWRRALGQFLLGPSTGWIANQCDWVYRWIRRNPQKTSKYQGAFLSTLPALARHPGFLLCGLATSMPDGQTKEIYVHSKLLIVDDKWMTLGSANLVDLSFEADHTELNISVWDQQTATDTRVSLFKEHLGLLAPGSAPLPGLNVKEQFAHFCMQARLNRDLIQRGQPISGHCYALDPSCYGAGAFMLSLFLEHFVGC